jgi:galactokinase
MRALLIDQRQSGRAGDAQRTADLAARFSQAFGVVPRIYRAPGRVNLIGEHTDYNDGFVLPAAIGLSCWVAAAPRVDRVLVVESDNVGERVELDLQRPTSDAPHWSRYIHGVATVLRTRGYDVPGAMLLVHSEVPMGAGLSSSASLEIATALALADLAGAEIAPLDLARICQQAEVEHAGARCGIMDQFVAAHGQSGHAILLDCRSLEHRVVPLPGHVRLAACNTMIRHGHAGGEYNNRRAECERGVALIAAREPHVRSLRDVDVACLEAHHADLPEITFRRCRHVVSENARVLAAVTALEVGDFSALERLMRESHRSLRDDYQVSCAELDVMVDIAQQAPGVLGARMTGGGFGGCTVNLVAADAAAAFTRHVSAEYERRMGRVPEIHIMNAGDGAGRVH